MNKQKRCIKVSNSDKEKKIIENGKRDTQLKLKTTTTTMKCL